MALGDALKGMQKPLTEGGMATQGIVILLTISAEEIANFFMFECPCDNSNLLYGL